MSKPGKQRAAKSNKKSEKSKGKKTVGIDVDAVFAQMDLNHDGRISVHELKQAARILGWNPTQKEAEQMIADCNPSQSGYVTKAEFTRLFENQQANIDDQVQEIVKAFKVFDKDNSGTISRDEIKAVLSMAGEKVDDEEIEQMLNQVDANGDGDISIEEFAAVMCDADFDL